MKKAVPPLVSDSAKDSTTPTYRYVEIRREFEEVRVSSCSLGGLSHLSDCLRKLVVVCHGRSTAACTATVNMPAGRSSRRYAIRYYRLDGVPTPDTWRIWGGVNAMQDSLSAAL